MMPACLVELALLWGLIEFLEFDVSADVKRPEMIDCILFLCSIEERRRVGDG